MVMSFWLTFFWPTLYIEVRPPAAIFRPPCVRLCDGLYFHRHMHFYVILCDFITVLLSIVYCVLLCVCIYCINTAASA